MFTLLIILGLLLLLATYLLAAPFYFQINTSCGLLCARFHRLAKAEVVAEQDSLYLKWRILGMGKDIDLLSPGRQHNAKNLAVTKKSTDRRSSPSWKQIQAIIGSFRVNRFSISLDTDNAALNGVLFPCFAIAGWLIHRDIRIDFNQQNELILEIQNNAFRVIKAYYFPNH